MKDTTAWVYPRVSTDGTGVVSHAGTALLREVADRVGAPIAKAYLAKALLPDDDPFTTGGIGHLGTEPSMRAPWTATSLIPQSSLT